MNLTSLKWYPLVICGALLVACASKTNIATNKVPDYKREPKRIFVIANIDDELGRGYRNGFEKKAIDFFRRCGAEMQFAYLSPLELDERIFEAKRIAYQADTVMSIRRSASESDHYGVLRLMVYDVRLFDVQTNRFVWRGNARTSRGSSLVNEVVGEGLAVALRDKLKEDQIFRSCSNDVAP